MATPQTKTPGFYADGDPWTYAEGRVCVGYQDHVCTTKLPDVNLPNGERRAGSFSPRCFPCRDAHRKYAQSYAGRKNGKKAQTIRPRKPTFKSRTEQGKPPKKFGDPGSAQAWKTALVEAIGAGSSVADGLYNLNVTETAYKRQRDRDKVFRAQVEEAKLRGKRQATAQEEALQFGPFAKKFFHREHRVHQLRIIDEIDHLSPQDVAMILLWPESGKTSTTEDWICRTLALDPTHRIRVVSESQDLARRIVGACSRRFREAEVYPDFVARYGPFYEKGQERAYAKPWTSDQLMLWKNPGTERDRNLVAQSWSGANYGSRIDTLIIDDVISQRNVGQSGEIFNRIRGTFFNRGVEMRTIIVGTRIRPGDFYDMMDDAGLITKHLYLAATGMLGAEPGYPTSPEMWEHRLRHLGPGSACCPPGIDRECPDNGEWLTPKEFLDLIRFKAGEETWWASYMQQPRADAVSTFGGALDQCKDPNRGVGRAGNGLTICSIDPALGGGTALVAANIAHDKMLVLDAYTVRGLTRTEEQIGLMRDFALKYKPAFFIVEYDAQQKGLGNDDRVRALGQQLGFSVLPHTTRGQKFDVPYNVASMNQSFVRKEISIPWSAEAKPRMETLVHQLRGWRIPEPGKRDSQVQDLVMATWFIWRYWMQHRAQSSEGYAPARRPSWVRPDPRRHLQRAGR